MADDKVKCVQRREIYQDTCTKIANEIKDLMNERETLDEERLHRILSLKHSITEKLEKIKEIDEIILSLEQDNDEFKKKIHQILHYHDKFFDLFVDIDVLTGSRRKSIGEENGDKSQLSRKYSQITLRHKKEEYIQSFTTHGLTKIFTGTRFEKIFWACIVLIGMCVANMVMYQLLTKYYRYEVATDVSVKITNKNFFPALTFCISKLKFNDYYAYCGVPRGSKHDSPDEPCRTPVRNRSEVVSHLHGGKRWSNGYLHVKSCKTNGGKRCTSKRYLKSLSRFNNTCFTLNWNGDLYDASSHMHIDFEMNKTANSRYSLIRAYIHDPKVFKFDVPNSLIILPSKRYELKISKTILKRLPHPYSSNCTTVKDGDIFRGKYTRRNCLRSMKYIGLLKQCGDVYDYHRRIIPPHMLKQYRRENQSINAVLKCIKSYSRKHPTADTTADKCPVPCEEVGLSTTSTVFELNYDKDTNKKVYRLGVQMSDVDSYKVYTERPIYSWDGIVGQVGGILGLITGTSFISCIEIIVCIILSLFHKVVKGKKRDDGLSGSLDREDSSMV